VKEKLKYWLEITQGILTCVAIISGCWYFFYRGEIRSKLLLEQEIESVRLNQQTTMVHISLKMENAGTTPVQIRQIRYRLLQVKPLVPELNQQAQGNANLVPGGQRWIPFPLIRDQETQYDVLLMPGESETVTLESTVPSFLEVTKVYIFVPNEEDPSKEIGWRSTSIHFLNQES